MKWESVNITDRISCLKQLMGNCTGGIVDTHDEMIVNALLTGSLNTFTGDMGFDIQPHHMSYMKKLWDKSIKNQINDLVITSIKRGKF